MNEQPKLNMSDFHSISIQKSETGWSFSLQNKPGETGMMIILDNRAATLDELVAKIKQHVNVD